MVLFCLWQSAATLWEAFGPGPPFYGRTTNMDKWQSPVLLLLMVNGLVLLVTFALFRLVRKP